MSSAILLNILNIQNIGKTYWIQRVSERLIAIPASSTILTPKCADQADRHHVNVYLKAASLA